MKVKYGNRKPSEHSREDVESVKTELSVDNCTVGHNSAEMYIRLGDVVIVLPPQAMKKLTQDLKQSIDKWEAEHGRIKGKKEKQQSVPRKVIKALYKSRKVSRNLVSINTKRRKHLPRKDD